MVFQEEILKKAEDFYQKKGAWALILGRFLPVVRTMNPLICGTGKVRFTKFLGMVVIGVAAYISSLILLGYFIGNQIPWVEKYLEFILPAIVVIALAPVIVKFRKEKSVSCACVT